MNKENGCCHGDGLHRAAGGGHLKELKAQLKCDSFRELLDKGDSFQGRTPLRLASAAGHVEIVTYLLEFGACVDVTDVKGQTALLAAVHNNHLNCVQVLLEAGADPDGSRKNMCTPLYAACQAENLTIVQELVKYGASLDPIEGGGDPGLTDGFTPLIESVPLFISVRRPECFKYLLLAGANPDWRVGKSGSRSASLESNSSLGTEVRHTEKLCGLSVDTCFGVHSPPDPGAPQPPPPPPVVAVNRQANLCLYHALIKRGSEMRCIALLYAIGADLYVKDNHGRTARDVTSGTDQCNYLHALYDRPRSLQQQCRILIRRQVLGHMTRAWKRGCHRSDASHLRMPLAIRLEFLPLPARLIRYLQFRSEWGTE